MPPRYAYWTIILDGKPTAFRARTQDELLPTLRQLQSRHPDAVMRWFSRGRLWHSPEEERAARLARMSNRQNRDRDWRPGGTHEDPRARFKVPRDEKRRRFREQLYRDRGSAPGSSRAPTGKPPENRPPGSEGNRPPAPREGDRQWRPKRPPRAGDRERTWKPDRPGGGKPGGDRGWKPARPPGQGGASGRGWNRNGPARGGRGPGKPGGGGPKGGGGRGGGGRGGGGRGGSSR
ncbi:MAG TPA: hypothetical protein VH740_14450 [Vicinamibacterales bacterium]|jgi:hypothetical protein